MSSWDMVALGKINIGPVDLALGRYMWCWQAMGRCMLINKSLLWGCQIHFIHVL